MRIGVRRNGWRSGQVRDRRARHHRLVGLVAVVLALGGAAGCDGGEARSMPHPPTEPGSTSSVAVLGTSASSSTVRSPAAGGTGASVGDGGPGIALPVRILALGDSITIGMHGTGSDWNVNKSLRGGYRARLQELLAGAGVPVDMVGSSDAVDGREQLADRDHEGHGGWCLIGGGGRCGADAYVAGGDAGIASHADAWLAANPADVVLLHVGTNDLGSGRTPAQLVADYGDFVDQVLTDLPDAHLFVSALHIDGRDDVNVGLNGQLRAMVAAKASFGAPVVFVDTYAGAPAPITGDDANGLHPSLAGYEVMGQNWFDALQAALPALFAAPSAR